MITELGWTVFSTWHHINRMTGQGTLKPCFKNVCNCFWGCLDVLVRDWLYHCAHGLVNKRFLGKTVFHYVPYDALFACLCLCSKYDYKSNILICYIF